MIPTWLSGRVERPVAATGSLSFTGIPIDGQTLTIGSVTFTYSDSGDPLTIPLGLTAEEAAENTASAINTESSEVTASVDGTIVSLTAVDKGPAGNTIALATDSTEITLSGSTLQGGSLR